MLDSAIQTLKGPTVQVDKSRDAKLTEFGKATLTDRYLLPEEDYQELKEEIDDFKKDVAINGAAIEYLDAKINELKAANDNPLLN